VKIKNGKIANYQVITQTSWNGSPLDSTGRRGHWEESFIGLEIKDLDNPIDNLWQGDDGFGVRVYQRLRSRRDWAAHVKIFEAGTAGLAALGYFEGCRKAVIVDALKTGEIAPFTNRISAALEAALEPVVELIARECMNQV